MVTRIRLAALLAGVLVWALWTLAVDELAAAWRRVAG